MLLCSRLATAEAVVGGSSLLGGDAEPSAEPSRCREGCGGGGGGGCWLWLAVGAAALSGDRNCPARAAAAGWGEGGGAPCHEAASLRAWPRSDASAAAPSEAARARRTRPRLLLEAGGLSVDGGLSVRCPPGGG